MAGDLIIVDYTARYAAVKDNGLMSADTFFQKAAFRLLARCSTFTKSQSFGVAPVAAHELAKYTHVAVVDHCPSPWPAMALTRLNCVFCRAVATGEVYDGSRNFKFTVGNAEVSNKQG